jgi:hypothetical protein
VAAIVTNANAFDFGLGKQTNGTTVLGTAAYSVPVFSSSLTPVYELATIEVTDASSIQGDPYRKPTSWSGSVEIPALAASLGQVVQTLWPTDSVATTSGTYTHTFTGLGGTQSWFTLFDNFTNATGTDFYGNGLGSELQFTATADGGPLRVSLGAIGATPSFGTAAFTVTTADTVSNGYFTLQSATASVKQDTSTPNSVPSTSITNVRDVTLTVARPVTPEPTVDAVAVSNLGQGKVTPAGTMTMLYSSWAEFRASFFGSTTGTAVSSTIVYGALKLNFAHSVNAGWTFAIYVPKVQFFTPRPSPDPGGAALTQAVTLNVAKPTSGDHVQPVLVNGVATAY